ncbi:MAG: SH3 domain-containing protein, partial [Fibrobacterota bacterium]
MKINRILVFIVFLLCVLNSRGRADTASVHFYGKLYRVPKETSALITMLEDRCKVVVLSEKGEWLEVQAKGYRGWILKSQTSWNNAGKKENRVALTKNGPEQKSFDLKPNLKTMGIGAFVLFTLGFSLILMFRRRIVAKLKTDISRNTQVLKINHQDQSKHHVIIISNKDKNVKSSISNVHKKLSSCFREIGFNVGFVDSLKIHVIETEYIPDIIAVDFEISTKVIKKTEKILLKSGFSDDVPVFFFNIPEPEKVEPSRLLKRTFYLGQTFTDQDLLKIAGAAIETFRQDGNA